MGVANDSNIPGIVASLSILGFVSVYAIELPAFIILFIQVQKHRKDDMIRVRDPQSMLILLSIGAVIQFLVTPWIFLMGLGIFDETPPLMTIFLVSQNAFVTETLLHFLHLYYKVKKSEEMQEWRLLLDPNYQHKSLFLRYSRKLGSKTIGMVLFGISSVFSIAVILLTVLHAIDEETFNLSVYAVGSFSLVCIMVLIWCTIYYFLVGGLALFNDKYYFHRQAVLFGITMVGLLCMAVAGIFIVSLNPLFVGIYGALMLVGMNMDIWTSLVIYPLWKNKELQQNNGRGTKLVLSNSSTSENTVSISKSIRNMISMKSHSSVSSAANCNTAPAESPRVNGGGGTGTITIVGLAAAISTSTSTGTGAVAPVSGLAVQQSKSGKLIEIITDSVGFESFMQHVISEFATENLIYVVYLIQFQSLLFELNYGKHFNHETIDNREVFIQAHWNLPQNVPKSSIFEVDKELAGDEEYSMKKVKEIVQVIFKQFVQRGYAPLEINISHGNRQEITAIYTAIWNNNNNNNGNNNNGENAEVVMDIKQFLPLWKALRTAGLQMWNMLGHSETRFKRM